MRLYLVPAALIAGLSLLATAQEADEGPVIEADHKWSLVVGLNNYHSRLETSERDIDNEINGLFGKLFLHWEEPETFKDWSDHWMLWDVFVGADRDLNEKWSLLIAAGGGTGTVHNEKTYRQFLLPLKFGAEFERSELFIEAGVGWFPFGKPWDYANDAGDAGKRPVLKRIRPVLELVAGYDYQTAKADVSLRLPRVGTLVHVPEEEDFHLGYLNPRMGLEFALDRRNSFGAKVGYVFFHDQREEFDSSLFSLYYRRRF